MRCTQTDEDETRTTISVEQEACELFDSQKESKVSVRQANSELGMGCRSRESCMKEKGPFPQEPSQRWESHR